MSGTKEIFTSIKPLPPDYNGYVILGDGTTKLPVKGIGDIQIKAKEKVIRLSGALYVPELLETLFSTLEHGRNPN
eukprot:1365670-Ditylum_brightwellii.AAC.1